MGLSFYTTRTFEFFPMRVLIIEDEAIVAMDLAYLVRSFGAKEVQVVSSAEEGLTWLKTKKPNLIFMDIKLKGRLDGIEAAKIIQANGPYQLVYITAYNDELILRQARQVPHLGIINKPFVTAEISQIFTQLQP